MPTVEEDVFENASQGIERPVVEDYQ